MLDNNFNSMYGMPNEVKYCTKCNVTNQTPTTTNEYEHDKNTQQIPIEFNENNVCHGCLVNEKKHTGIPKPARSKPASDFGCSKWSNMLCR